MTQTHLVALYELRCSNEEHKRYVTLPYGIEDMTYNEVWDAVDEVVSHRIKHDYQLLGWNSK